MTNRIKIARAALIALAVSVAVPAVSRLVAQPTTDAGYWIAYEGDSIACKSAPSGVCP
jgi:hypothetical protein